MCAYTFFKFLRYGDKRSIIAVVMGAIGQTVCGVEGRCQSVWFVEIMAHRLYTSTFADLKLTGQSM